LRHASKKHWSAIIRQMRAFYTAPTVNLAQGHFAEFADTWRDNYPAAMIRSWEACEGRVRPVCSSSPSSRARSRIQQRDRRPQRAVGGVRHREHFPNEQAALNMLYLVATQRRPNRENPSGEIQRLDELAESADCQLSRLHHRNEQMTITAALYQESDSSVPRGLQGRRANVTGSRRTWAWSTFSL
jgi:transposase-like protein